MEEILSSYDPIEHAMITFFNQMVIEVGLGPALDEIARVKGTFPVYDTQLVYSIDAATQETIFNVEFTYGLGFAVQNVKTFQVTIAGSEPILDIPEEVKNILTDDFWKWGEAVKGAIEVETNELITKQVADHMAEKEKLDAIRRREEAATLAEEMLIEREVLADPLVACF